MSPTTVSVIIPNYNHGQYLRQRIESVLNQTYRHYEVIILDDCSTDNSREIIQEYAANPQVKKIVLNEVNSGSAFEQWQRGVDLAEGEWIWLAESDDYADHQFLEVMIAALCGQDGIGLVYCDSKIVSGDTISTETFADIKNKKYQTNRWSTDYRNRGRDELEKYLLSHGTINNASAVLFHSKTLRDSDPFDLKLRYIGDKYAYIKVLAKSDLCYVRTAMNYYRDPFNSKYEDKLVFLFREQFLVFNWVYRNVNGISHAGFFGAFYAHTNLAMYSQWNMNKLNIVIDLLAVNAWLLIKCLVYNLFRPFLRNSSKPLYDSDQ